MKPLRIFLLASFLTLGGCAPFGISSYPTPIPTEFLPTVVAQTAAALHSTALVETATAFYPTALALTPSPASSPTPRRPTRTPFPTATFPPTATHTATPLPPAPPARIQIESPGPMSLLVSPLSLHLFFLPGETERVQIALFGEDGRPLTRDLRKVEDTPPRGVNLSLQIPFSIRAAELARLEVSIRDGVGRIEALESLHLTLLPFGTSRVNPPPPPFERAVIYSPAPDSPVFGGILAVEGAFWPVNDQPVILELQDAQGRILMTRQLALTGETYVPFATTLPYKISEPVSARLSIRQADPRFDAIAYLYSLVVLLNP